MPHPLLTSVYYPLPLICYDRLKMASIEVKQISTAPGRLEPPVTVIMLSPGVSGASRHLGFASESSLRSSRFLLDPNILSDCVYRPVRRSLSA